MKLKLGKTKGVRYGKVLVFTSVRVCGGTGQGYITLDRSTHTDTHLIHIKHTYGCTYTLPLTILFKLFRRDIPLSSPH